MNTAYFISKRIDAVRHGGFSYAAHRIAVASVAIGLGAVLVSFLIMRGFQNTIEDKIYRFSAHLVVSRLDLNNAMEGKPFFFDVDRYTHELPVSEYIRHIQEYSYKSGLIRTDRDALGVVFKGVDEHFDVELFRESMVEGDFLQFPDSGYSTSVIISRNIADKLNAQMNDDFIIYFFQNPPRIRRLHIAGIYETNLSDYFDDKMIIGDLRLVQRINGWADSLVNGVEIYVKDRMYVDLVLDAISRDMDYDLYVEKTRYKYAEIFDWLDLVRRQVMLLLVIIFTVVCVNMVSIILILVMERAQMIGLLKAIGASNGFVRKVFFYKGLRLIVRGLIYGNVLGLGLCFIQDRFRVLKLNAHDYYISFVPIAWDWGAVLMLNFLILITVGLALLIPVSIVSRVDPIKSIRFD